MDLNATRAMAFYHPHGLVSAWKQAMLFAGEGGRIATLPDIIEARIANPAMTVPWNSYFTTSSAEYYGLDADGRPVVAVAHGVGPLSTMEGCLSAYSKDTDGRRRTGRIERSTFLRLLAGEWGDVYIVDWENYLSRRGEGLLHAQTAQESAFDPWTAARLGGEARAAAYMAVHAASAAKLLKDELGEDTPATGSLHIYQDRDLQEARYIDYDFSNGIVVRPASTPEDGGAWAHLLSVGQACFVHRQGMRHPILTTENSPHEWNDGTRLVGVGPGPCHGILREANVSQAMERSDPRLWVRCEAATDGFDLVIECGTKLFTAYPKSGESMDTGEAMYHVTACEEVGKPAVFSKEPSGYYGFFRYSLSDVRRLAPPQANAYRIDGEPWLEGGMQKAKITFLRIEVDKSRRLMRSDEVYRNSELVIALAESQPNGE